MTKELIERLAAIEHQRWADWQKYMHSKCKSNGVGELLIPAELVRQWERQIATPYADLSEAEKGSDRDQVRRYWPLIEKMTAVVEAARAAYNQMDMTPELYDLEDALTALDNELIERLRVEAIHHGFTCHEAADALEAMSAENRLLKTALEDIVDEYKTPMNRDAVKAFGLVKFKARQALTALDGEGK